MSKQATSTQDYQVWSRKTAIYAADIAVQYTALGLAGEVGEICNEIKKVYRDDDGYARTRYCLTRYRGA